MNGVSLAPVVDLTPWFSGSGAERQHVADEVAAAVASGFLQVVGHGIGADVRAAALQAMSEFFALDTATKQRFVSVDGTYRGWTKRRSEGFAATLQHVTPADLVEGFVIGAEDRAEANLGDVAFAPNLWPDESFERALWTYYVQARKLSEELCKLFGIALGVGQEFFSSLIDHSNVTMRANYYDRRAEDGELSEAQMALGAHSDYGIVTVLLADPGPGLQVVNAAGEWCDLEPADDALIINVGDAMALLTNDHWPSTIHRVVPAHDLSAPPRRSIALFQDGNPDAMIACLSHCVTSERPARYEPTTLGAQVTAKVASSRTRALACVQQTTAGRLG
jgi:isopenicillin N synthase-like dioxygenase